MLRLFGSRSNNFVCDAIRSKKFGYDAEAKIGCASGETEA